MAENQCVGRVFVPPRNDQTGGSSSYLKVGLGPTLQFLAAKAGKLFGSGKSFQNYFRNTTWRYLCPQGFFERLKIMDPQNLFFVFLDVQKKEQSGWSSGKEELVSDLGGGFKDFKECLTPLSLQNWSNLTIF